MKMHTLIYYSEASGGWVREWFPEESHAHDRRDELEQQKQEEGEATDLGDIFDVENVDVPEKKEPLIDFLNRYAAMA